MRWGIWAAALCGLAAPGTARAQTNPAPANVPASPASAPVAPAPYDGPARAASVAAEPARAPAPGNQNPEPPRIVGVDTNAEAGAAPGLPAPRAANPLGVAFTSSLFAGPDVHFPVPDVGVALGVNLGPWVMLEGAVGIPYAFAGAKLFWSRDDVTGYVAGRVGVAPGDILGLGSIGLDVSRDDGTYAFVEAGPLFARTTSTTDASRTWRFSIGVIAFGIGFQQHDVPAGASANVGFGARASPVRWAARSATRAARDGRPDMGCPGAAGLVRAQVPAERGEQAAPGGFAIPRARWESPLPGALAWPGPCASAPRVPDVDRARHSAFRRS